MKYSGPEFGYAASAKLTTEGERIVMCFPMGAALSWYRTTIGGGATVSLSEVCNKVASLEADQLSAFCKDVTFKRGKVVAGQGFVLPAGWILIEKVCNNKPVKGFRTMAIPATVSKDWATFIDLFLPANPALIPANNAAGFLVKILKAIQSADPSVVLSGKLDAACAALTKKAWVKPKQQQLQS